MTRFRSQIILVMVVFLTLPQIAVAAEFTASERATILSLGPWPPAAIRDPGNRASGNAEAIALGKKLFFDRRLSKNDDVSCADCHQPDKGFADGFKLNTGYGKITRHTPAITNLRWNSWFGWGGEADSLWAQSIRPMLSRNEMAGTPTGIRRAITQDKELTCRFRAAFDRDPAGLPKYDLLVLVAKALAAWQETLVTQETPFDLFRNALAAADTEAMNKYPSSARRGLKIFAGRGRCTFCHFGPRFSNGEFGNIGVSFFVAKGEVDHGRYGGLRTLKKSPYNLLGKYNDDPTRRNAIRTRHVRPRHRNWGEFKVPSLRNVAETAPYMHNGSISSLEDVVRFYDELDEERLHTDGEKILRPLGLSDREKGDLRNFLLTLSAPVSNEKAAPLPVRCPNLPNQE
jgi:cytochrome c peroxidase